MACSYKFGYFPTPLDLVIITEFSDWLWEHIFASFSRKNKGMEIRNPSRLFFPEPLWPFYGGPYKKIQKHTKLGIRNVLSQKNSLFSAEVPQSKKESVRISVKGSVFSRFLNPFLTIQQKYPKRDKYHRVSKLIILGRVCRKFSSRDKEGWCL